MSLLRFWHVTLQITAVPLTKISMVKPFIGPVHGISAHLSTLFFSVLHLFPLTVWNQPPFCSLFGETTVCSCTTHAENVLFFS